MEVIYEELSIDDVDNIDKLENTFINRLVKKNALINDITNCNIYGIKASMDGKVVGYGYVSLMIDHADLIAIGVNKDYRRLKIASSILSKMEIYLKQNLSELEKIFLEVRANNISAINLYESLGYIKINTRKKYYENVEDAYVYEKDLTK